MAPGRIDYEHGDIDSIHPENRCRPWKEARAWDYSIRLKKDPERHVGSVSPWTVSKLGKIAEFGYWVRSDEHSKGICTEAVDRLLDEAFNSLGYH